MNIFRINMGKVEIPVPSEQIKNDIVFFGQDNLYPKYITLLYQKSPKLSAMISTIADFISGDGFTGTTALDTFISNPYGTETLNDILPKIAIDLALHGSYVLNIIWSKDGKSIAQIEYVNVVNFRFNKELSSDIQYGYISNDWKNSRKAENTPVRYQMFDGKDSTEKSQLIYVNKYSPDLDYYASPFWIAGINYVELDNQVSTFHLASCLNRYSPSVHINVPSSPTEEEKEQFMNDLDSRFQGSENASTAFVTFSETPEKAVTLNVINPNSSDSQFKDLEQTILQNILISCKATSPELFGIKQASGLVSSTDLTEAFNIYQKKTISSFQAIITNSFNKLVNINGIEDKITINIYIL